MKMTVISDTYVDIYLLFFNAKMLVKYVFLESCA